MHNISHLYKVYHKNDFVGRTRAPSPQKAISNVRFKNGMRYAPINEFRAIEIKED